MKSKASQYDKNDKAVMTKPYPFWWENNCRPAHTDDKCPKEADVIIIGAGLTGLSAARTLAKAGVSVCVIDAQEPGIGASSRNGGMVGGGHRLSLEEMTGKFGRETAIELIREAHIDSLEFVKSVIDEENFDCNFSVTGRFQGVQNIKEYETASRTLDLIKSVIPIEAHSIPKNEQHTEIASDLYHGGLIFESHGALNPAKYHRGFLNAAKKAGALVLSGQPVVSLQKDSQKITLNTEKNQIVAGQVLVATNGYTPALFKTLRQRIFPVPSFIVATEELPANLLSELIPKGRNIVETRNRHCYYRRSPDGKRLIFGARAALKQIPMQRVEIVMRDLISEIFPQLTNLQFSHNWRGLLGFNFDMLPHIGRYDGFWCAMGYCGSGNAMAPWLGHKAAQAILAEQVVLTNQGIASDSFKPSAFMKTPFSASWMKPNFYIKNQPWFLPLADLQFRGKDILDKLKRS